MRAVVYRAPGEVELAEVPEPTLQAPTDAIVRVTMAGICGTDLHTIRGDYAGMTPGAVLGHEFVGVVTAVGTAVQRLRLGDAVMAADFTACGLCRWCDREEHWHCPERAFFGTGTAFGPPLTGAQAEFVRVPYADRTLGLRPAELSPEAGLLMSDNLATGWSAIERAQLSAGEHVAVIGGGAVGQLTALSAQAAAAGCVILIEPNAQRRAFAEARGLLTTTPDQATRDVRAACGSDGADIVIEAVGGNGPLDLALQLVRPRGRVISVGAHSAPSWQVPVGQAFRNELTLGFSIGDAIRLRRRLTRVITSGALNPTAVIDARGALDEAPQLYQRLAQQSCMKAVLIPNPD